MNIVSFFSLRMISLYCQLTGLLTLTGIAFYMVAKAMVNYPLL